MKKENILNAVAHTDTNLRWKSCIGKLLLMLVGPNYFWMICTCRDQKLPLEESFKRYGKDVWDPDFGLVCPRCIQSGKSKYGPI